MSIESSILDNEASIRMGVFFGMLVVMGLWEWLAPRRAPRLSRLLRWGNNLALVFLNSAIIRVLFPAAAVGMAAYASEHSWGLFNVIELPAVVEIIAAVILLDFIIYLQHVLVHAVPALWRLHRVHHADLDYDVTTGVRFHPIEIIFSMLIKFAAIAALGPAVVAVVIFEVLLNGMAMFNHGNVGLPEKLDRLLRLFIVTPDMHRVHHSIEDDETNSNFGFNLSWWDRLFGTYRAQPRMSHETMQIGIRDFDDARQTNWLHGILLLPFIGRVTGYAINRRSWSDSKHDNGSH